MTNLTIDRLDNNYFASFSPLEGTTIDVWDKRSSRHPLPASVGGSASNNEVPVSVSDLQLRRVFDPKTSIWSLRFSRTKRGCLGVLSSAGHFKAYDIIKEYLPEEYQSSFGESNGQGDINANPEQIFTRYTRDVCYPFNHPKRGCAESERVVAFDFLNISSSNEPSAITLTGTGEVGIAALEPPGSRVGLSSQGVLVRGNPGERYDFTMINPLPTQALGVSGVMDDLRKQILKRPKETADAGKEGVLAGKRQMAPIKSKDKSDAKKDESTAGKRQHAAPKSKETLNGKKDKASPVKRQVPRPLSSRKARERALSLGILDGAITPEAALTWLSVNRLRCKEGYLFDVAKNKRIVADDPTLQGFWDWIEHARRQSSGSSMIVNGLDLNYLGVHDVWNNDLGSTLDSRKLGSSKDQPVDTEEIIYDLVQSLALTEIKSHQTAYSEHRRLCLYLCRAAPTVMDLEQVVQDLLSERQLTKAAALAVFQREFKLASSALRIDGSTQAHKLLAMAIAGAAKGEAGADWEETCEEIAAELTDPFARAILAFVSKGDWKSVIEESTLPLQYRLEVAIRWLSDDELTSYLGDITAEAIREGDIEGVWLTGLGHTAMDLFAAYLAKFNDVQTPVLAMSHTVPRFVNDERSSSQYEAWRQTYRLQMNSWKLQFERARFDVSSRRFAVTWDGRKLTSPPIQQVSLSCNYCTRPLSQQESHPPTQTSSAAAGETVHHTAGNPLGSAALSGTVCPRCGRHMPRCGVCSLWLGSPDPMSKASIAADSGSHGRSSTEADLMRRFVIFCLSCNHGFHGDHARAWFAKHKMCPVAECNCICDR